MEWNVLCNSNRGIPTSTWNELGVTGNTGLKTLRDIVEDTPITFEEAFLIIRQDGRKLFIPPTILTPPESREDVHGGLKSQIEEGLITISKDQDVTPPNAADTTNPDVDILGDADDTSEEVLRLRGGSYVSNPDIPRRVIHNCNRYVHPRLWTDQEMLVKIRMRKKEFLDEFCPAVIDASTDNMRHEHESKCFLFLIKMTANDSFDNLAADFMINRITARRWFLDILFALFLTCPYIPSLYNDEETTDEEIDALLESIRNEQSPYVKHIVSAFRAEDGRPVTLLNDDYTGLLMDGMSSIMTSLRYKTCILAFVVVSGQCSCLPSLMAGASLLLFLLVVALAKVPEGGIVLPMHRFSLRSCNNLPTNVLTDC